MPRSINSANRSWCHPQQPPRPIEGDEGKHPPLIEAKKASKRLPGPLRSVENVRGGLGRFKPCLASAERSLAVRFLTTVFFAFGFPAKL